MNRSTYFSSMQTFSLNSIPIGRGMCFTHSKNYIYKPHSGIGRVGTTAYASRVQKRKI